MRFPCSVADHTTVARQLEVADNRCQVSIHPRDLATTLIAFANADGGRLLIGVEDDGSVSGLDPVTDREQVERLLRAAYECCTPSVQVKYQFATCKGRRVLVVDVPVSTRVHNHTNGRVYLRVLDRDQPFSADETLRVAFAKGQASYETQPVRGATLEDVDLDLVAEYARLRGLDQPPQRILQGLNLLVEDTLTVAGVLLFAPDPSRWLPGAGVDFLRFEGRSVELGEAFNLVKREELVAPLPRLIQRNDPCTSTGQVQGGHYPVLCPQLVVRLPCPTRGFGDHADTPGLQPATGLQGHVHAGGAALADDQDFRGCLDSRPQVSRRY